MADIDEIRLFVRCVIEDIRRTDVEDDPVVILNVLVDLIFEFSDMWPLVTKLVSPRPWARGITSRSSTRPTGRMSSTRSTR